MMPSRDLIKILRVGAQGLDTTIRFLILDACDRLERQIRDNELLMQKIVRLRTKTVETNADRIRYMSDEELSVFLWEFDKEEIARTTEYALERRKITEWLQQPAED